MRTVVAREVLLFTVLIGLAACGGDELPQIRLLGIVACAPSPQSDYSKAPYTVDDCGCGRGRYCWSCSNGVGCTDSSSAPCVDAGYVLCDGPEDCPAGEVCTDGPFAGTQCLAPAMVRGNVRCHTDDDCPCGQGCSGICYQRS
jgi:hypothetical protein